MIANAYGTEMNMLRLRSVVGMLVAGLWAIRAVHAETPMTFQADVSEKGRFIAQATSGGVIDIFASGEISEDTADKLIAFVKAKRIDAGKVYLDSPGGSLAGGVMLGRAIRGLHFYTTVGAYNPSYNPEVSKRAICASACAYAFAGGTSRFLDDHSGRLGIHQFYAGGSDDISGQSAQQISGLIVAYLEEMGVDANAFAIATIADRNGMVWLTPEMAAKLRFVNNGDESPTAEIKLAGIKPYLRVQQEHYNVTTRVLFLCEQKQLQMMFGIVTEPDTSAFFAATATRSYLELDGKEAFVLSGTSGASADGSVVWIERDLTPALLLQLAQARVVDGWIDGSGAVRYGAGLDMPAVRTKVVSYAEQCFGN